MLEKALRQPGTSFSRGSIRAFGCTLCIVTLGILHAGSPASVPKATGPHLTSYRDLPLSFEPNRGQTDGRAEFLSRGPGYGLFLTRDGAMLSLESAGGGPGGRSDQAAALSLRFAGANPHPRIRGVDALGGEVNYLRGGDRSEVGIPTFSVVRYAGLWPGIGMRFYGSRDRLEYDFDLDPGARPSEIALRFAGQGEIRLSRSGVLLLRVGSRVVRQLPPHAFQTFGATRRPVASRYVLLGDGRVGISLGHYDRRRPLTIDPRLDYSTYLGGGILGWGTSIAVGRDGSAYVTGTTPSARFPRTTGTFPAEDRRRVAFVTKLSPSGRRIIYSTVLGGPSGAHGRAIAVDAAGDAFVAGRANSTDFPHTPGSFEPADAGTRGAFVAKLGPNGRHLLYSAYLGRQGGETGITGLAVDPEGDAYVTGMTTAHHFPTTRGAFQHVDPRKRQDPAISSAGFVTKLNRAGSRLLYSTYLSGSQRDLINAIAVDRTGHAYVTGWAESGDYPTTPGAFETRLKGPYHEAILVTKLNRRGSKLAYSTFLSGGQNEQGSAITVDSKGRAYIAGDTESPTYPVTKGAYEEKLRGSRDFAVSVISPRGRRLEASTYLGAGGPGGVASEATAIGLLPDGDVVVAGTTNSSHFRTTPDALQPKSHSHLYDNSLITVLSPDLRQLRYASYFSGGSTTHIRGLATGPSGSVFVTGGSNPGLVQTTHHLPRGHDRRFKTHPNAFISKFKF